MVPFVMYHRANIVENAEQNISHQNCHEQFSVSCGKIMQQEEEKTSHFFAVDENWLHPLHL
jgi:hypothetical protein